MNIEIYNYLDASNETYVGRLTDFEVRCIRERSAVELEIGTFQITINSFTAIKVRLLSEYYRGIKVRQFRYPYAN